MNEAFVLAPTAPSQNTAGQTWVVDPLRGRPNRKPVPTEYEAWEPSPPQISLAVPVPRMLRPTPTPRLRVELDQVYAFDDVSSPVAPVEYEEWVVPAYVAVGHPNRKPAPTEYEAWEPSPPQISLAVPVPRMLRPNVAPRRAIDESWSDPPFVPPVTVAEFESWAVEGARGATTRLRSDSPDAWEPSPPQPTEYQTWVVDPLHGRANRKPAPTEYESWETSPPQPARFQTWTIDALQGRDNRKIPPWEYESGEEWTPQPTKYQSWTIDPAVGKSSRRPGPTEYESWESSSPQPAKYNEWIVASLAGKLNRKPSPTEYESWESSSPQIVEFQWWTVDSVTGRENRKPAPTEYESWETSSPQPARFQTWSVDAIKGRALRKAPPWETDAWEPSPPEPTRCQIWVVDPMMGRANRKLPPWEYEAWEASPPQPAEYQAWTVDGIKGMLLRRPPPWEGDAWEPSPPKPTEYQAWTIDGLKAETPRRVPPWEYESWESSSPQITEYQTWYVDGARGSKLRSVPPWEREEWDWPVFVPPIVLSEYQAWFVDSERTAALVGRPEYEALDLSSPSPSEYDSWFVDSIVGRANRNAPPWEYETFESGSPSPSQWQAWTTDARVTRSTRLTIWETWEASPIVITPPTPPTPVVIRPFVLPTAPQDLGGGGWIHEPRPREEWREQIRELRRKQKEREERERAETVAVVAAAAVPVAAEIESPLLVEQLPIGIHARVRADVDGVITFEGSSVHVAADDGAVHVYEGVTPAFRGPEQGSRVEAGQTIARSVQPVVEHRVEKPAPPPSAPQSATSPYPTSPDTDLPRATGVAASQAPAPAASTGVSLAKAALAVAAGVVGAVLIAKSAPTSPSKQRVRVKALPVRAKKADSTIASAVKSAIRSAKSAGNPYPTPAKGPSSRSKLAVKGKVTARSKPVADPRPIDQVVDYPADASIQTKWIKCGKSDCKTCPHGPYYYAMWRDGDRVRTKYLGRKVR